MRGALYCPALYRLSGVRVQGSQAGCCLRAACSPMPRLPTVASPAPAHPPVFRAPAGGDGEEGDSQGEGSSQGRAAGGAQGNCKAFVALVNSGGVAIPLPVVSRTGGVGLVLIRRSSAGSAAQGHPPPERLLIMCLLPTSGVRNAQGAARGGAADRCS